MKNLATIILGSVCFANAMLAGENTRLVIRAVGQFETADTVFSRPAPSVVWLLLFNYALLCGHFSSPAAIHENRSVYCFCSATAVFVFAV